MHTHRNKGEEEVHEIDERDDDDQQRDGKQGVSRRFVAPGSVSVGDRLVEVGLRQRDKVDSGPFDGFSPALIAGIGVASDDVLHNLAGSGFQFIF